MSKMDAPSMQDVYILSPLSGLYSTRSDIADDGDVDYYNHVHGILDDNDDDNDSSIQRGAGSYVM